METVEQLGQEIASLSAHLDAAAHRLLECIRRFDEACGWQEQGAVSCAHWLAWRLGWDPATAREKVRVARALGMLPAISESLRTARLSYARSAIADTTIDTLRRTPRRGVRQGPCAHSGGDARERSEAAGDGANGNRGAA